MFTCISSTWGKLLVFYFFTGFVSASVNRNGQESSINLINPVSESGFNLNEEDMAKFHIWPTGSIPYYIDDFSFDKALRDRIRMFLSGVNSLSTLHFVEIPRPPEDDNTRWVFFLNRKGFLDCADHYFHQFTNEGVQKVVLGYHCLNSDENLADIVLSLVGVPPQHNSPDRDEYVEIKKNNILTDKLDLFNKLMDDEWLFHNVTYDFESAGHYGTYKYTSNGKATVKKKHRDYSISRTPKENGFSSIDILKIAMLYNYIVRNREAALPECEKLFAPGSKLSSSILENTELDLKPIEKPKRYLSKSKTYEENYNDKQNEINASLENSDNKTNDYDDNDNNKNYEENYISEIITGDKNANNASLENSDNETNNYDDNDNKKNVNDHENVGNNDNKDYDDAEAEQQDDNGDEITESVENNNTLSNTTNDKLICDIDAKMYNNGDDDIEKDSINEENSNVTNESVMKSNDNYNDFKKYTISNSKHPLSKKNTLTIQKLLGQSDYETGDEGDKKYIHEKSF